MKQKYKNITLVATLILLTTFISFNVAAAERIQLNKPILVEKSHHQPVHATANGYAWLPLGDGTNGRVTSLATDDSGNLYAGGYFTQAGGIDAQVAKWDGNSWSTVGSRVDGYNVYSLTIDTNENVYAALYSFTDGQTSNLVRKWDGETWLTLGGADGGIIWDLAVDNAGNLYAGGEFTQIGGVSANNIAKWDGITWSNLGAGTNRRILALAIDPNGILYAGGSFSQAGSTPADSIAKWDTLGWHSLDTGPVFGGVKDLITNLDGDLYVAYFDGVAIWDGNSWITLSTYQPPESLTIDENGGLYISHYEFFIDGGGPGSGNYDSVEKWMRGDWLWSSTVHGYIGAINYGHHRLFVGGSFGNIEGVAANSIAMLIPSTFSDVPIDHWAQTYIERLYNSGITGGCGTNPLIYCPETTVTRSQMAVFLLRGTHGSSYSPPSLGGHTGFGDVPTDYWSASWIKQLAAEGITGGCGSGNYCPEYPVTRDQMAVFLLRSKYGSTYSPPPVGASTGFGDVPTNHWAAAWIKQLVVEGITAGCGNGNYCPETPVTRAQMAVFLVRTFNLP